VATLVFEHLSSASEASRVRSGAVNHLCAVGISIIAGEMNPFAVGRDFAEHAVGCNACTNDVCADLAELEARG
jgi:hypothetical protein